MPIGLTLIVREINCIRVDIEAFEILPVFGIASLRVVRGLITGLKAVLRVDHLLQRYL